MRLVSGKLLLVLFMATGIALVACSSESTEPESAATADVNKVTDIVWEWVTLKDQSTQETTNIPNPENYNLILREDGTFSAKADCNQVSGTYSTENGYSFNLGPSTMAACGEDSLDQKYIQLLSNVAAGGPDGAGGFALEEAGGAQRMEFRNGGPAPTS